MIDKKRTVSPDFKKEDETLDFSLRPQSFNDYIGQTNIKKNISIIIDAAKKRKEPQIEHLLFYGGSGLGKTTLSFLISKEMRSNMRTVAGPSIKRSGDLAAILTNLKQGDVLFIDEIHRMNSTCEEVIYPVMEDFKLNIVTGEGLMARTIDIKIPPFTLVGATTKLALLSAPFRSRFGATFRLDSYKTEEIEEIIKRSANVLKIKIEKGALKEIASCSRFNPRVANRLLKRVRDFSQAKNRSNITKEDARVALSFLDIDEVGLDSGDRKVLEVLINNFNGGPAGIGSVAIACGEEEETIAEIHEPYLMQIGFIKRTKQGRVVTEKGREYFSLSFPQKRESQRKF
jgi:holliday junction DNA helicase RuvB